MIFLSTFAIDQSGGDGGAPTDREDAPEDDTVKNRLESQFFEFLTAQIGTDEEQCRHHDEFGDIFQILSSGDDPF